MLKASHERLKTNILKGGYMAQSKGAILRVNERAAKQKDLRTNRHTLHHYLHAMWQHKWAAITVGVNFTITALCFGTALPYILAHAVDLVSQHQLLSVGSELFTTLTLAAVTVIVGVICNAIGLRGFVQLDSPTQNDIRTTVFDRIVSESAAFHANSMTGSLTGNVIAYTNGYAAVQEIIFQRCINLFLPLFVGIFIVAMQSLALAGFFILIAIGIGVKTIADSRKRAPYRRARKEAGSKLNGFLGDTITNSAAIRIFAAERHEKQSLDRVQTTWRVAAQANMSKFSSHYISLVGSVNILQVGGIGLAAWLASTGQISLGLVVFAIAYFQRLSNGLLELAPLIQNFQGALMDAAPISEMLMATRTVVDQPNARRLVVKKGEIAINDLTYRYEADSQPVFDTLNLTIKAGQSVGVVGRSGGGKTTLTNLILRFADSESGTIAIDGHDITNVTQRSLRSNISYVPQDSFLFHRSIRDNIAYGKPAATEKAIISAAKKAHVWDLIKELPDGLDTTVGERGVKLSGGQRQRIAIARAILKDAPVLIFDEATSALDSESEQYIQSSLDTLKKGRTTVVIAHRLSTIQKMDRIIVLEKGTIVEDGTHEELINKKGLYAKLWKHQSGGFIQE